MFTNCFLRNKSVVLSLAVFLGKYTIKIIWNKTNNNFNQTFFASIDGFPYLKSIIFLGDKKFVDDFRKKCLYVCFVEKIDLNLADSTDSFPFNLSI